MKTPYKLTSGKQPLRMARSLASAAVLLSLAACDSDALNGLQNDLANGEDVSVNVSTNDDGSVVISFNDDDDSGDTDAPGALFDEATDGEISGDANSPLSLQLADGSNVLNGAVVAGDIDYCLLYTSPSPRD